MTAAGASAGMVGSLEPQTIAGHLLNALVERFHSPCCISLVEPDGEDVRVVAGWMPDGQALPTPIGHQMRCSDWSLFDQLTETQQLIYRHLDIRVVQLIQKSSLQLFVQLYMAE